MLQTNKLLTFFSLWLLILLLVIVFIATIPFGNFQRSDFGVYLTFFINGFLWTLLLIKEVKQYSFSLMMIHWSFCLLFFFFAAIIQYSNNVFPWVNYLSDDILTKTNLYLTCWTFFVIIGNLLVNEKEYGIHNLSYIKKSDKIFILTISLTLFSIFIMFYRINEIGFINLFSRATSGISYSENSSTTLLLGKILQSISYFAVIFSFINKKLNKKGSIFVFVSCLSLLISFFPTGLARNTTGVIYLGLLLTLSKTLKTHKLFIILFLGAFLILFPFLNAFRNISFYNVSITKSILNVFNNLSVVWLAGDYDAYTMLNLAIDYIHINSITFGYQLLGVVLFFIPRIFWISKPIGSGAFIAENNNWNFTNVSCPLPAESLINFGFIGLIIFGISIGFIAKKLDLFYWENIDIYGNNINRFELIYPVLLMCFFFMNRGDLLSSTAYMMGFVFIWYMVTRILISK